MTVGIAFTNGKEAVAVTDCRTSYRGRKSDSRDKIGNFSSENYTGVIFGTGLTNYAKGVVRNLDQKHDKTLDEFVRNIHRGFVAMLTHIDKQNIECMADEIYKKSELTLDEEARTKFIENEIRRCISEYERDRRNRTTYFIVSAYDFKKNRISQFMIDPERYECLDLDHYEIGSGSDAANLYFTTRLQGIDTDNLDVSDLVFNAMNAYSQSTVNQGVGGTPRVALISKQGTEVMPTEQAIDLTNLSGIYLSEFPKATLNNESTRAKFREILTDDNPRYDIIADLAGVDRDILTSTYVPMSSWQERANRMLYSKEK